MASNLSIAAISEYARRVAEQHGGYDDEGWISPEHVVLAAGGTIRTGSMFDDELTVRAGGAFEVSLKPAMSLRRRRFAAARGLGRYTLHWLYPRVGAPAVLNPGDDYQADVEAHVFAVALLMPEPHFRAAHAELGGDEWALSRRFGVSPLAAETMQLTLGLGEPTRPVPTPPE